MIEVTDQEAINYARLLMQTEIAWVLLCVAFWVVVGVVYVIGEVWDWLFGKRSPWDE